MNALTTAANGEAGRPPAQGRLQAFPDPAAHDAPNLIAAIWRYRWAALLPAALGAIVGFLVHLQMDETYRSTSELTVESDRGGVFDQMTGELVGGVPSIEVVESQLFSDQVLKTAFNDESMKIYRDLFPGGLGEFADFVIKQEALSIEPEVTDANTAQSLVFLLHFDSGNKDFSRTAVKAFSDALQDFYNKKHTSSKIELANYIDQAMKTVLNQMQQKETQYREFRRDAPLAWDADGKPLNPHRERQLFLVQQKSELTEKLRKVATEKAAVESVVDSTEDPEVALLVLGQLLEKRFTLPFDEERMRERTLIGQDDEQLAVAKVDEQLVPAMVKKIQLVNDFGPEHPKVKQLEGEIEGLREQLTKVSVEQANRIKELLEKDDKRRAEAAQAITAIVKGMEAQVAMLSSQIEAVDGQVKSERAEATKIAGFELDHESMVREMEQQRDLMDHLGEQMARVSLSEEESETRVRELKAPTDAYVISPILIKNLAVGTFLGLVLGGGLAFLLEKNANTFRDPDEISQVLGTPVLTHVPFFKGRQRRLKKGETNPYQDLDPYLAVVHHPSSVASEAIRSLRTSIFFELGGSGGKLIQVTSPLPGDGKSTIVGNLACCIAQSGKRVLAIDCDLRRPQLTDSFAMGDRRGLTDVLNDDCEPSDAIHEVPVANLHVMPSGPIPANPADALTLPEMSELLELLRDRYDYILMDTPPLLVVTDPSITASMADGVVLALRIRRKSKPNAKESANILRAVGARILGVVINNSDEASASDGYRGYGYYRYGRYTNRYYRRNGTTPGVGAATVGANRRSKPVVVSGRRSGQLKEARLPSAQDVALESRDFSHRPSDQPHQSESSNT